MRGISESLILCSPLLQTYSSSHRHQLSHLAVGMLPQSPTSMLFAASTTRPLLPRRSVAILPELRAARSQSGEEASEVAAALAADEAVSGGGASGALRGSDVLRALQRAVAKREARQPSNKKKPQRRATADVRGKASFDVGEQVRPIQIRSDWGQRIDELERRIQELRSQYQ